MAPTLTFRGFPKGLPSFFAQLEKNNNKRVPRGYDPDHRHADLLKHNGLYAAAGGKHPGEIFTADAVGYCLATFRHLRPVEKWLADNVGA